MLSAPSSAQVLLANMTFPSIHDISHLCFVTASISGWKHLFIEPTYAQIVLDSLSWMQKEKRILLFAFVIMPSHIHLALKPESDMIGNTLQQIGSFTAHAILNELRKDGKQDLLDFFNQQKRDARHQHSIWQDIQASNIYSSDFLFQKMEYIHSNPVSKDWRLVKNRADYKYSSACFYDNGIEPVIQITNVNEWLMV
ncbi:MAG: hypothetical protein ABIU06_10660 [Anaerolineales bacterium]